MKSKVYKIEKIAGTKFLSYYDLSYKNKNGKEKSWSAVSRADTKDYEKRLFEKSNQRDAVLIGAYHIDMQKLVLVKQFRVPLNDYIYEIPAEIGLYDEEEVRRILADKNKMDIKTLLVMQMFILSTGMWKVEKK